MAIEATPASIDTEPMRAIVSRIARPEELRAGQIDKPVAADDGIVVRVQASSINPVDFFPLTRAGYTLRWLSGRGKARPIILGTDFAGTVESVGGAVTRFKPGDEVFGGHQGAFADYLALPESGPVVRKPSDITFEEAAAVPVAAVTALQAVRDHGRVQPGQKVLVNGASGGVGSYALQLANLLGAAVTAVCSTRNVDQAHSLGADRVIDYSREDFTRSAERYDVLLDIAGSHSWSESTRVLERTGTYVLVGASTFTVFGGSRTLSHILRARLSSLFRRPRFVFFIARLAKEDLAYLADLLASRRIKAVIDREYRLEQVAQAMAYMGEGHARGKIVLRI
jgi:NADPH:quinone reductase-like Zn-dependent oxidoreductase